MADMDQGPFLQGIHVLRVEDAHERLQRNGAGEGQKLKNVALAGS